MAAANGDNGIVDDLFAFLQCQLHQEAVKEGCADHQGALLPTAETI